MWASSFNWQELKSIRSVCPDLKIALLDGLIHRKQLLKKAGADAERYLKQVFAYGCEDYMLPRFTSLSENLELLDRECPDPHIHAHLAEEIGACLSGRNYTDELLDAAREMNAESVNLWYRTVTQQFVDKVHQKGLAVLVYTVNAPDELLALARMGVDGIFTDYYSEAALSLAPGRDDKDG